MSLKTWLVGLGLFGITNGAAAQSTEQNTEDKKDNTTEALTGNNAEGLKVTPVTRHKKFSYRIEQGEDDSPAIKVDIPLAKKRVYKKSVIDRMAVSEDSLQNSGAASYRADSVRDDDETQATGSSQEQPVVTAHSNGSSKSEQTTDSRNNSVLKVREYFMNDAER